MFRKLVAVALVLLLTVPDCAILRRSSAITFEEKLSPPSALNLQARARALLDTIQAQDGENIQTYTSLMGQLYPKTIQREDLLRLGRELHQEEACQILEKYRWEKATRTSVNNFQKGLTGVGNVLVDKLGKLLNESSQKEFGVGAKLKMLWQTGLVLALSLLSVEKHVELHGKKKSNVEALANAMLVELAAKNLCLDLAKIYAIHFCNSKLALAYLDRAAEMRLAESFPLERIWEEHNLRQFENIRTEIFKLRLMILMSLNRIPEVVEIIRQYPDLDFTLTSINVHINLKQFSKAKELIEAAQKNPDPENKLGLELSRGVLLLDEGEDLLLEKGDAMAARAIFEQAYRHSVELAQTAEERREFASLQACTAMIRIGQYEMAEEKLKEIIASGVSLSPRVYSSYAQVSVKLGKVDQAFWALGEMAKEFPLSPDTSYRIYETFAQMGLAPEALEAFSLAYRLSSDDERLFADFFRLPPELGATRVEILGRLLESSLGDAFEKAIQAQHKQPQYGIYPRQAMELLTGVMVSSRFSEEAREKARRLRRLFVPEEVPAPAAKKDHWINAALTMNMEEALTLIQLGRRELKKPAEAKSKKKKDTALAEKPQPRSDEEVIIEQIRENLKRLIAKVSKSNYRLMTSPAERATDYFFICVRSDRVMESREDSEQIVKYGRKIVEENLELPSPASLGVTPQPNVEMLFWGVLANGAYFLSEDLIEDGKKEEARQLSVWALTKFEAYRAAHPQPFAAPANWMQLWGNCVRLCFLLADLATEPEQKKFYFEKAERYFTAHEEVLKNADPLKYLSWRTHILLALGREAEAKETARQMIALNGTQDIFNLMTTVQMLQLLEEHQQAVDLIVDYLNRPSASVNFDLWKLLAQNFLALGKKPQALVALYTAYFNLNSKNPECLAKIFILLSEIKENSVASEEILLVFDSLLQIEDEETLVSVMKRILELQTESPGLVRALLPKILEGPELAAKAFETAVSQWKGDLACLLSECEAATLKKPPQSGGGGRGKEQRRVYQLAVQRKVAWQKLLPETAEKIRREKEEEEWQRYLPQWENLREELPQILLSAKKDRPRVIFGEAGVERDEKGRMGLKWRPMNEEELQDLLLRRSCKVYLAPYLGELHRIFDPRKVARAVSLTQEMFILFNHLQANPLKKITYRTITKLFLAEVIRNLLAEEYPLMGEELLDTKMVVKALGLEAGGEPQWEGLLQKIEDNALHNFKTLFPSDKKFITDETRRADMKRSDAIYFEPRLLDESGFYMVMDATASSTAVRLYFPAAPGNNGNGRFLLKRQVLLEVAAREDEICKILRGKGIPPTVTVMTSCYGPVSLFETLPGWRHFMARTGRTLPAEIPSQLKRLAAQALLTTQPIKAKVPNEENQSAIRQFYVAPHSDQNVRFFAVETDTSGQFTNFYYETAEALLHRLLGLGNNSKELRILEEIRGCRASKIFLKKHPLTPGVIYYKNTNGIYELQINGHEVNASKYFGIEAVLQEISFFLESKQPNQEQGVEFSSQPQLPGLRLHLVKALASLSSSVESSI